MPDIESTDVPSPAPVSSVNNKTGAVILSAFDVGAASTTSNTYTVTFSSGGTKLLPPITANAVSTAAPLSILTAFAFTEVQAKGLLEGLNAVITDGTTTRQCLKQLIEDLKS